MVEINQFFLFLAVIQIAAKNEKRTTIPTAMYNNNNNNETKAALLY